MPSSRWNDEIEQKLLHTPRDILIADTKILSEPTITYGGIRRSIIDWTIIEQALVLDARCMSKALPAASHKPWSTVDIKEFCEGNRYRASTVYAEWAPSRAIRALLLRAMGAIQP